MNTLLLSALLSISLASVLAAQTCREVVRDASGRVVQTVERQKSSGGNVQATMRDASGRIIGTATTNPNTGGGTQTLYRDASGRAQGSADRRRTSSGSGTNTQFRDASGRMTGSTATNGERRKGSHRERDG